MRKTSDVLIIWNYFHIIQNIFLGILALKDVHIQVPQAVFEHSTVYLVCKYDLEQVALYSIKWYFREEEFYRFVPKESPPTRIFPLQYFDVDLSHSNDMQVCLRQISQEQTGMYKCEITADAPLFHTEILSSYMTVISVNQFESPILSTEITKAEIGRKIRLNCSAPASKPASNLTWFLNDKMVLPLNKLDISITHLKKSLPLLSQQVTWSRLQTVATADKFRNGKITITCQAHIFNIFKKNATSEILEFMPHFASVMGTNNVPKSIDSVTGPSPSRSSVTATITNTKSFFQTVTIFVTLLFLLKFYF